MDSIVFAYIHIFVLLQDRFYWTSVASPLTRFPIFVMGILGGVQVLRAHYKNNFIDTDLEKPLLHSIFPFAFATKITNSLTNSKDELITYKNIRSSIWRRRVDFSTLLYVGLSGFLTCTTYLVDVQFPYSPTIRTLRMEGNTCSFYIK